MYAPASHVRPQQRKRELHQRPIALFRELLPAQPDHSDPGSGEGNVALAVAHEGALRSMELVSVDLNDQTRAAPVAVYLVAADFDVRLGLRQTARLDEFEQPVLRFRAREGSCGWIHNECAQRARSLAPWVALEKLQEFIADGRIAMICSRQRTIELGCV